MEEAELRSGPPTPEEIWDYAIRRWIEGDTELLCRILRQDGPIPVLAREWLADLAAGKVKKKRGPRPAPPGKQMLNAIRNLAILGSFEAEVDKAGLIANEPGTPTERALVAVADDYGLTVDQVSRVVFPRQQPRRE